MDPELGIDSVIAIPIEDWSLDLVTPNAECIRKDGACIAADFPNPPDESRVEFFNQVHTFEKMTKSLVIVGESYFLWLLFFFWGSFDFCFQQTCA